VGRARPLKFGGAAIAEEVGDERRRHGHGRRTFDLGVGPWGGTPWPGGPSFVVTHRARPDLLGDNGGRFAFCGLEDAVEGAKQAAAHKDVLVLGADVARQLLRAGLLDEVRIHLVPLLLGG
jgi:dihydrofolate reductase